VAIELMTGIFFQDLYERGRMAIDKSDPIGRLGTGHPVDFSVHSTYCGAHGYKYVEYYKGNRKGGEK